MGHEENDPLGIYYCKLLESAALSIKIGLLHIFILKNQNDTIRSVMGVVPF